MSTIAQWGPSFTTEAVRATTPGDRAENIFDSFHYDFISFLSFARFHRVDFLPNKWDGNRNSLGRGATGDVKQSVVSLTTSFAFKRFINPNKETMFRELISEVSLLKQIPVRGHPNIVDLEGISFELDDDTGEATPVLVFKRAQFGSIRSFLETGGGRQLGFVKKLKLCSEIGSAIMALHASDVVHGDIKPDNILIFGDSMDDVTVRVTDFGYSCMGAKDTNIVYLPVSRDWCAPEYHDRGIELHRAKMMDIYSFGMVCLWVLFGEEFAVWREELEDTDDRVKFQRSAMDRASTAESSGCELRNFFELALCKDWQEREADLEKLVVLLGHDIWKQNYNLVERPLTFADLDATPDDIKDPDKLHAIMRGILHSIRLTGSDYRMMQDHLDPSQFEEKQKTEWYIKLVLEGLSKFSVRSYEQESDLRYNLIHGCFNIGEAMYQFLNLDYRVGVYITNCLETRMLHHNCDECQTETAFQLAFCYTVGFGTHSDLDKAKFWLEKSGSDSAELDRHLSHLNRLKAIDFTISAIAKYGHSGSLNVVLTDRYPNTGRLNEAKLYYGRALSDLERCIGQDHILSITIGRQLQFIAQGLKQWEEAAAIGSHLKNVGETLVGQDHILTLMLTLELVPIHIVQRKWQEVEKLLLEIKEPLARTLEPDHPLQHNATEALASLYAATGRSTESISVLVEATQSQRRVFGHDSLADLVDLANSGWGCMKQGDLEMAEDLLFHAKEGFERLQGPDNPGTMMATRNLALTYRKQGRFQEAEEMQANLKSTIENAFGPTDLEALNVTYDLGRTYQMQSRLVEALELMLKVKEGRKNLLGPSHPLTIHTMRMITEIYSEQGRLEEAEVILWEIKECFEKTLGHSDPETLRAMREIGIATWKNGKLMKAEEMMVELIKRSEESLGPESEETLGSMGNIGELYRCQRRFEEAEEILSKTKEKMDTVLGPHHPYSQAVTHNLVNTYRDQGKFGEAFTTQLHRGRTNPFPVLNFPAPTPVPAPPANHEVDEADKDDEDDEEALLNAALAMSLVPDSDVDEEEILEGDNPQGHIQS